MMEDNHCQGNITGGNSREIIMCVLGGGGVVFFSDLSHSFSYSVFQEL